MRPINRIKKSQNAENQNLQMQTIGNEHRSPKKSRALKIEKIARDLDRIKEIDILNNLGHDRITLSEIKREKTKSQIKITTILNLHRNLQEETIGRTRIRIKKKKKAVIKGTTTVIKQSYRTPRPR